MSNVKRKIATVGILGALFVLLSDDIEEEGDDNSEDVPEYHEMTDEEFSSTIRSRNADRLGVSEEEMDEMNISEIERRLDIETNDPKHTHDSDDNKGGYFISNSFKVLSREKLETRREKVKRYLDKF